MRYVRVATEGAEVWEAAVNSRSDLPSGWTLTDVMTSTSFNTSHQLPHPDLATSVLVHSFDGSYEFVCN